MPREVAETTTRSAPCFRSSQLRFHPATQYSCSLSAPPLAPSRGYWVLHPDSGRFACRFSETDSNGQLYGGRWPALTMHRLFVNFFEDSGQMQEEWPLGEIREAKLVPGGAAHPEAGNGPAANTSAPSALPPAKPPSFAAKAISSLNAVIGGGGSSWRPAEAYGTPANPGLCRVGVRSSQALTSVRTASRGRRGSAASSEHPALPKSLLLLSALYPVSLDNLKPGAPYLTLGPGGLVFGYHQFRLLFLLVASPGWNPVGKYRPGCHRWPDAYLSGKPARP